MATHSSVLAWRIPGTEESGGLPSVESLSRTRLKHLSSSCWDSFSCPFVFGYTGALLTGIERVLLTGGFYDLP